MKIGELGEQCGVTAKTIRYYESIGLLEEPGRTPSGYRDYGDAAVERLRFIRDAQNIRVDVAERKNPLHLVKEHTNKVFKRKLVHQFTRTHDQSRRDAKVGLG